MQVEWSASYPSCFTASMRVTSKQCRGWADLRAQVDILDAQKILCSCWELTVMIKLSLKLYDNDWTQHLGLFFYFVHPV